MFRSRYVHQFLRPAAYTVLWLGVALFSFGASGAGMKTHQMLDYFSPEGLYARKGTGLLHVSDGKGEQIAYEVRSNGRIPVVMVHGGPGVPQTYYRDANAKIFLDSLSVSQHFGLIEFDQRGVGKSKPSFNMDSQNVDPFTSQQTSMYANLGIDDIVDDMQSLQAELGIKKWVVLGGSWGSTVAIRFAQKFPARTLALILRDYFGGTKEEMEAFFTRKGRREHYGQAGADMLELLLGHVSSEVNCESGASVLSDLKQTIVAGGEAARTAALRVGLDEENVMDGQATTLDSLDEASKRKLAAVGYHQAILFHNMAYGENAVDITSGDNLLAMKEVPVWLFHATDDPICPAKFADDFVGKLRQTRTDHEQAGGLVVGMKNRVKYVQSIGGHGIDKDNPKVGLLIKFLEECRDYLSHEGKA